MGAASTQQICEAERRFGPIGVAGVYGVGPVRQGEAVLAAERIGRVKDRGRMLNDGPELPARAPTLDELLLVLPRDTPLRFDPALGFHLYGADICLQAAERGLAVVVLEAPCDQHRRASDCPTPSSPARTSSRANGSFGCRSPRRAL